MCKQEKQERGRGVEDLHQRMGQSRIKDRGEPRGRVGRRKANSKSRGALILADRSFRKADGGEVKGNKMATNTHSVSTLSVCTHTHTPTLQNHHTNAGLASGSKASTKARQGLGGVEKIKESKEKTGYLT